MQKYCPIIDQVTFAEALANGWVSDYKEYVVLIDVDDIQTYKEINKEWITHYEFFNYDFDLAMSMVKPSVGLRNKLRYRDMTIPEFSDQMDVLYNNITSNQAPGLNEYEKSLFLTKAEKEIVKNYFNPNSQGNTVKQGFDDSAKRQADFSVLMKTDVCAAVTTSVPVKIDDRSSVYTYPPDVFIVVNETVKVGSNYKQVIPLRYDEYTRLMSKPYKRPLKNQVWRLMNSGTVNGSVATKTVEIIAGPGDTISSYSVRYVRTPKPIIVGNLDGLTIDGESTVSTVCEIDPILHEDILQRAVELAKIAWTATGQDNAQMILQAGQRSE
jgi:hypothetical protein